MRKPVELGTPIVVKIGSSSLAAPGGGLDDGAIVRIVDQVASCWLAGYPTVLVSSGAVAAGLPILAAAPSDLPGFQVAAAVGQGRLMHRYTAEFERRGRVSGQVLLTKNVLADRDQYLNAREAMTRMLELGVVPVVNENDTVGVEELRFGDNDRLAAIVGILVGAGMLILLTDTAGLYSSDPRLAEDAELISAVKHTDQALDQVVSGLSGPMGKGGVASKVAAARISAWSGIPTVIADSKAERLVADAVAGREVGTWVDPHPSKLSARKLWIAFGQPAEGSIAIDGGAVRAIAGGGKSLLAAGVTAVTGEFSAGAAVEVLGPDRELVAKGLTRVGSLRLAETLGRHSSEVGGEVIHRDDLVVLRPG